MKIKLISTIIAGILIAGCGSDSDDTPPTQKATVVYAYDGPVNGLAATYRCGNGETGTTKNVTDGYGAVTIYNDTFAEHPETCSLTLKVPKKGDEAFDMINGKDMSEVVYTIPQGFLEKDRKITASPLTTLLDMAVKESGETNPDNIDFKTILETEIFPQLDIIIDGINLIDVIDPIELLSDPEKALRNLAKEAKENDYIPLYIAQDLITQIAVLSDNLIAQETPTLKNRSISVSDIIKATNNLTVAIQEKNEFYPNKEFDYTGTSEQPIFVELAKQLENPEIFNGILENIISETLTTAKDGVKQDPTNPPVKPTPIPPTGGGDGGPTD